MQSPPLLHRPRFPSLNSGWRRTREQGATRTPLAKVRGSATYDKWPAHLFFWDSHCPVKCAHCRFKTDVKPATYMTYFLLWSLYHGSREISIII